MQCTTGELRNTRYFNVEDIEGNQKNNVTKKINPKNLKAIYFTEGREPAYLGES